MILWRDDQPLIVGFDGQRPETSYRPGGIDAQASSYLRRRDGWVAWDAYRERGPYRLSWSLAAGAGTHRTIKGRRLTSAGVDPLGKFLAVSESTALRIGTARAVVSIIRTNDGSEIFCLYLPQRTRSHVVFFEGGLFGYFDCTRSTPVERASRVDSAIALCIE